MFKTIQGPLYLLLPLVGIGGALVTCCGVNNMNDEDNNQKHSTVCIALLREVLLCCVRVFVLFVSASIKQFSLQLINRASSYREENTYTHCKHTAAHTVTATHTHTHTHTANIQLYSRHRKNTVQVYKIATCTPHTKKCKKNANAQDANAVDKRDIATHTPSANGKAGATPST